MSRMYTVCHGHKQLHMLPPPPVLEIYDSQVAEKYKKVKWAWNNYSLATELNKKSKAMQIAMLLTETGEEAREFSTFTDWIVGRWLVDSPSASQVWGILPATKECAIWVLPIQPPHPSRNPEKPTISIEQR